MRLEAIIPEAAASSCAGEEIASLALDSRKVGPRSLFFAVPGTHADGLNFAADAVSRGAIAIVAERMPDRDLGAPVIVVRDARLAVAQAAAARIR